MTPWVTVNIDSIRSHVVGQVAPCYNTANNQGERTISENAVTRLTREQVEHVARLARVGLSQEELERFRGQLSNILENFQILQGVDTEGVPPTAQVTGLQDIMREDGVSPSLPQGEVLANAPQAEEGCFKVRAVLGE